MIDYEQIEKDNLKWAGKFEILEEAFDPWNAAQFALRMANEGVTMVEVPQNVRSHSAPMKELEALIRAGRFHYDGNAVLKWMFSNVLATVHMVELEPNDVSDLAQSQIALFDIALIINFCAKELEAAQDATVKPTPVSVPKETANVLRPIFVDHVVVR